MTAKLMPLAIAVMLSTCLSGCLDNGFSETDSDIVNLQDSLAEANYSIMLKDGEIAMLSNTVSQQQELIEELGSAVNGSLEETLQDLQERYRDLSILSFSSNQTILDLEHRLNEEIALREQMQEEWNYTMANRPLREMSNSYLRDAGLSNSDLSETDLSYSNLIDANLNGANVANSDLRYADLEWAYLMNANLSGSDLTEAYLYNTNMEGANLIGANLSYTYTVGLRLIDANLLGSDLTGIGWSGIYWGNTVCPDGSNSDDNGDTCENNS